MIKKTFIELLKLMHQEEIKEWERKNSDYASEIDCLSNFKEEGKTLDLSSEIILGVYLNKHLSAIKKYIKTKKLESEPIEERIKDARLYLALLNALISDKKHISLETNTKESLSYIPIKEK